MSKKIKKRILFDIYSNNLSDFKTNLKPNKIIPTEIGLYCPLCTQYYGEDKYEQLTLEHNPPNSLGGKDNILTCKQCNNSSGSKIDSEILLALNELDLMGFKPNASLKTRLYNQSTGENGVNATVNLDSEGKFIINISPANNPAVKDAFLNSFEYEYNSGLPLISNFESAGLSQKLNFEFKKPNKRNERLASIGLLKIAYLIGFEKLGHAFVVGKHMELIRSQIKYPEKEIISKPFWIHNNYTDDLLGVNIITKPKELKSFLIVFDLQTKSDVYRIGICIPGYDENDINVYNNIETLLCQGEGDLKVETNSYLNTEFDIKGENNSLLPIKFWEEITK
ncbi:HNH endonuclease [Flavobacterium sp.]|uniref:HNH endonuclease n=1 Tax=Flavobacterium sp. TaxID=239 RepID=UPI003D6BF333